MGNYCCSEKQSNLLSSKIIQARPKSLKDPSAKKQYQKTLEYILNQALQKFQQKYHIHSLKLKGLIGKGGQASVFQVDVLCEKNQEKVVKKFAMKRVSKHRLDKERARQALLLEKQILISRPSPFITQIEFACQDQAYLYFFMKLAQGGDSYSLIKQSEKIDFFSNAEQDSSEAKVKQFKKLGQKAVIFILASVILGIESLHSLNVIYRDLKPENILLFEDGYPRLADFGVAAKHQDQDELCFEMKGTVLYFAPEMMRKKGYDRGVDLWALGVLAYQFIFRQPPFSSSIIKSPIFNKKIEERIKKNNWPHNEVSIQMKDFINKLLVVNPKQRLGYNSFDDIKAHPLFSGIDWNNFQRRKMQSPLKDLIENYPVQIMKEKEIDETIQYEELGYIPFTFVRNTQDKARSTRQIIPTTFVIDSKMNLKVTSETEQSPLSSHQLRKFRKLK